jgi:hypothetical protein
MQLSDFLGEAKFVDTQIAFDSKSVIFFNFINQPIREELITSYFFLKTTR